MLRSFWAIYSLMVMYTLYFSQLLAMKTCNILICLWRSLQYTYDDHRTAKNNSTHVLALQEDSMIYCFVQIYLQIDGISNFPDFLSK